MSILYPRTTFNHNCFSASVYYPQPEEKKEPEPEPIQFEDEQDNEIMEVKREIKEDRENSKKKIRIPGEKLLKKLHRQQQLENATLKVLKDLKL